MGRILKEFLEELDASTKIKIGAENGSSFFYVGVVEDLLNNLSQYDEKDHKHYDDRVNNVERRLQVALNKDTSYSGFAKRQYNDWKNKKRKPIFDVDSYNVFLKKHSESIQKLFESLVKEKTIRFERKKLGVREVINTFVADTNVEPVMCIVIIIEGDECGVFWDTNESPNSQMSFGTSDSEGDIDGE